MATFLDSDGVTEIEIPTLEFYPNQHSEYAEMLKVSTTEDFRKLVKAMGWKNVQLFEKETGVTAEELVGRWWLTQHNRVWIREY